MTISCMHALAQLDLGGIDGIPSFGWAFLKMIIVLVTILIGLLVALRWLGPKLASARKTDPCDILEIVASLRIEPKTSVYLICLAGQYHLMGNSERGMVKLSEESLDHEAIKNALTDPDADSSCQAVNPTGARAFMKQLKEQRLRLRQTH